jgi:preprotein translocase subunit YajC
VIDSGGSALIVLGALGLVYWIILGRPKVRREEARRTLKHGAVGRMRTLVGLSSLAIFAGFGRIRHFLEPYVIGALILVAIFVIYKIWRRYRRRRELREDSYDVP